MGKWYSLYSGVYVAIYIKGIYVKGEEKEKPMKQNMFKVV